MFRYIYIGRTEEPPEAHFLRYTRGAHTFFFIRDKDWNVDTTGFIAIIRTFFTSGRPGQGV